MDLMEAHNYCISKLEEHGLGDKVEFTLSDNNHRAVDQMGSFSKPHSCSESNHYQHDLPSISLDINWVKMNDEEWLKRIITHEIAHALHYEACLARGDEFPVERREDELLPGEIDESHGEEFHYIWENILGRSPYPSPPSTQPNARWIIYCPACDFTSWSFTFRESWDKVVEQWNGGSCPRCRRGDGGRKKAHVPLHWVRSLYLEEKDLTPELRSMEVPGILWRPRLSPALKDSLPPLNRFSGLDVEREHPSFTIDSWGMSGRELLLERIEQLRARGLTE